MHVCVHECETAQVCTHTHIVHACRRQMTASESFLRQLFFETGSLIGLLLLEASWLTCEHQGTTCLYSQHQDHLPRLAFLNMDSGELMQRLGSL